MMNLNFQKYRGPVICSPLLLTKWRIQRAHPDANIILAWALVMSPFRLPRLLPKAMHDAVDEMGKQETFHGYGPEQAMIS